MVAVLLLVFNVSYAFEGARSVCGEAVSTGDAELVTGPNSVISLKGKPFPISEGAKLRTRDGSITVIMKNGERIEVGKNSELTINENCVAGPIVASESSGGISTAAVVVGVGVLAGAGAIAAAAGGGGGSSSSVSPSTPK